MEGNRGSWKILEVFSRISEKGEMRVFLEIGFVKNGADSVKRGIPDFILSFVKR